MRICLDDNDIKKISKEQHELIIEFNEKFGDIDQRLKNIRMGDKALMREELNEAISYIKKLLDMDIKLRGMKRTLKTLQLFRKMLGK